MTTWSLRPATPEDAEPMMRIGHEGLRPHVERVRTWDEQEEAQGFRQHFAPEQIEIIVVEGRDVGYVKVEHRVDHWYLDGIYLDANTRGQGVGTGVLQGLLQRLDKPVRLRVYHGNPAQRLYGRLGFRVVSEDATRVYMEHPAARLEGEA